MPYPEGGHISSRTGGDWGAKTFSLSYTGTLGSSEQGAKELKSMLGQVWEVVGEMGLQNDWLQHVADEPIDVNVDDYMKISNLVKEAMPGVRILEATMSTKLTGSVDVWCPQVQEYQAHLDWFKDRQEQGDKVWVYTCLSPGGPWLNRLLDQERLREVYIGWAGSKFGWDGYLHWGLNHHRGEPFTKSVTEHPDLPDNDTSALPAGDTHVVYPGPDGPWSSTRFEAHRIGMEDFELLEMLRRSDATAADKLIAVIFRDAKDFELNPAAYRKVRREVMALLSAY
jgi:hypothetical protein